MYTMNRIGDIMISVKESGTQGLKANEQAAWPAWSPALPLPLALPHGPFGLFHETQHHTLLLRPLSE